MEFRVSGDWRERHTRGYATYAGNPLYTRREKTDFENFFADHSLLHTIKHMENPLQKNLGDSIDVNSGRVDKIVLEVPKQENNTRREIPKPQNPTESGWRADIFPTFFGITSFITGFFNNITSVATLLQTSPALAEEQKTPPETYKPSAPQDIHRRDCGFAERGCAEPDESPPIDDAIRHFSRRDCSKNNVEASGNTVLSWLAQCEARGDVAGAAARDAMPLPSLVDPAETCQNKMARIQDLLAGKVAETRKPVKPFKRYCPKKIFIDPKFVQEKTVESFVLEPLGRLESVDTTDFVNPGLITLPHLPQVETLPRVKFELNSQKATVVNGERQAANEVTDAIEHLKLTNDTQTKGFVEIKSVKDEVKDISGIGVVDEAVEASNALNKQNWRDKTKVTCERACDLRAARGDNAALDNVPECISTCEDKLSRLKALISERKKNTRSQKVTKTSTFDSKFISDETVTITARERPETMSRSHLIDSSVNQLADYRKSQTIPQKQSEDISIIEKPQNPTEDVITTNDLDQKRTKSPPNLPQHETGPEKQDEDSNRLNAKKRKQLRQHNDNESELSSSAESSPKVTVTPGNGFDEIRGRFESGSSSDDSFVIVFSDSPASSPPCSRDRNHSDTSEDSFIVFDGGDGAKCFTVDDSSESDSDECETNLASAGRFSRTVADLTDESLYNGDGWRLDGDSDSDVEDDIQGGSGVLLTEEKKRARKGQPVKRVRFSEKSPQVHVMRVWAFAAKQARVGNWRQHAADAERFKRRIADVDMAISWVLKPQHRNRVKFQRFMPWWHQQRRQEAAERRAQEERRKAEEERRKIEELERIEEERRIEEEVKAELAMERKNRKKVTTQEFAKNMSLYLAKMQVPKPQQSQHQKQQQRHHKYQQHTAADAENFTVNGINGSIEDEIITNKNYILVNVSQTNEHNMDSSDISNRNISNVNVNKNATCVSGENVKANEIGAVATDVLNENIPNDVIKSGTDVNVPNKEISDLNVINGLCNGLTEGTNIIQKLHL